MLLNASGCLDALTAPDVARSLDAFVTKTVTPLPRDGNAPVRIAETEVGMLNSIGLANPGIDLFLSRSLPQLAKLELPIWVSVGGFAADEYAEICSRLDDQAEIAAIELNVSCPNVQTGRDVLDFVAAGAQHVALGTVLFADPDAPSRIRDELAVELEARGLRQLADAHAVAHGAASPVLTT